MKFCKFKIMNLNALQQFKKEGYECYMLGINHRNWFFGLFFRSKVK
jgi:hypothetical protein